MKKIKSILLLSVLGVMFSMPVCAAVYSISTSTYTLAYKDFPSQLAAETAASVRAGTAISACVGVDNAGGECGLLKTGEISKKKLFFSSDYYDDHVHFTKDANGNISNKK